MTALSFDEKFENFWDERVREFEAWTSKNEDQRIYEPQAKLKSNPRLVTEWKQSDVKVLELDRDTKEPTERSNGESKPYEKPNAQTEFKMIWNYSRAAVKADGLSASEYNHALSHFVNNKLNTKRKIRIALRDSLDGMPPPVGKQEEWFTNWVEFKRDIYCDFAGFPRDDNKAPIKSTGNAAGGSSPKTEGAPDELDLGKPTGQCYLANAVIRRAIEMRAMEAAKIHYGKLYPKVDDTSAEKPYDLSCKKDGTEALRVEVKGTKTAGESVLVTSDEVNNARDKAVLTELFVWGEIQVDENVAPPVATGGRLVAHHKPWTPADDDLVATQYRYRV